MVQYGSRDVMVLIYNIYIINIIINVYYIDIITAVIGVKVLLEVLIKIIILIK